MLRAGVDDHMLLWAGDAEGVQRRADDNALGGEQPNRARRILRRQRKVLADGTDRHAQPPRDASLALPVSIMFVRA
jgi:hypothetical protein